MLISGGSRRWRLLCSAFAGPCSLLLLWLAGVPEARAQGGIPLGLFVLDHSDKQYQGYEPYWLKISGHTGSWWYRHTTETPGQCTQANGKWTNLTVTLTRGTSYTFEAYSDSNCTTRLVTAAPFTPPSLEVSDRTPTSAKLTLTGTFAGTWWYQHDQPDASCTVVDPKAVVVSNLSANTTYIYTAYNGSSCEDRVKIDDVTFSTPTQSPITTGTDDGGGATAASAPNDQPSPTAEIEDQTATAGEPFTLPVQDATGNVFVEQGNGPPVAPGEPGWPGWLAFDAAERTFSGEPSQRDAPANYTVLVEVSDDDGRDTIAFQLTVEPKANLQQGPDATKQAKQWLARFGRTLSSQVVESIAGRMGNDAATNSIVLGGHPLNLSAESTVVGDSDRASSSVAHGHHGAHGDPFAADPFAPLVPSTREHLNNQSIATSPTSRELLTGSSFRLALSPGSKKMGGAAGHWTLWGEAALTNFDGKDGDLSLDGEVFTGLAAADWQQDQWLLGLAVSRSQGDGEFAAPATAGDEAIAGTVSSALTALYPYARIRPRPGLELWGAAGYGRGTMTLDAEDGSGAEPDVWLTMAAVGGRSSLLATDAGGFALDLTADALFTRTGAEAAGSLRDAVDAATTRLRMGLEGSWAVQGAEGTAVVPTFTTALRYDAGDAETGFGVELGSGVAYRNPSSGLSLSADVRGLLSNQEGEGGIAFREWGVSGSIRYDRGGDDLGLTVAVSPSWGVAGSRADQLRSDTAPSFAIGHDSASNSAVRLEGEIGYGFTAFNGNGTITPYGGLGLADGSRHWRIGGRFDVSPSLNLGIEGIRREQAASTADHGVKLDLETAW